jgi:hypothetical protein
MKGKCKNTVFMTCSISPFEGMTTRFEVMTAFSKENIFRVATSEEFVQFFEGSE